MTAIYGLLVGPGSDRDGDGEASGFDRLDVEAVRHVVAHLREERERMGERELDQRTVAAEAADVDVLDTAEAAERALERRERREVAERARVEPDAPLEALLVLGAARARDVRRAVAIAVPVAVRVAVAVAVRRLGERRSGRLSGQDGLALLDAPDGVVEVADDAAHRLDERVA